jgi:hypothetical protein
MIYGGVLQKTVAGSGGVEGGRGRPIVVREVVVVVVWEENTLLLLSGERE